MRPKKTKEQQKLFPVAQYVHRDSFDYCLILIFFRVEHYSNEIEHRYADSLLINFT